MTRLSAGSEPSSPLRIGARRVGVDPYGYLRNPADWDEATARALAQRAQLRLEPAHWEVLHLLRRFYAHYGTTPNNRALVQYLKQELGAEKGSSLRLLRLFPGSPVRLACRIAGLPRPAHCL